MPVQLRFRLPFFVIGTCWTLFFRCPLIILIEGLDFDSGGNSRAVGAATAATLSTVRVLTTCSVLPVLRNVHWNQTKSISKRDIETPSSWTIETQTSRTGRRTIALGVSRIGVEDSQKNYRRPQGRYKADGNHHVGWTTNCRFLMWYRGSTNSLPTGFPGFRSL